MAFKIDKIRHDVIRNPKGEDYWMLLTHLSSFDSYEDAVEFMEKEHKLHPLDRIRVIEEKTTSINGYDGDIARTFNNISEQINEYE